MRVWKNSSSDDLRERYLGEIAPLLDAARSVDCLSPTQKQLVRKRIVRTLFRTRFPSFRVRWVPVLAALGMLVIGGAAFAAAERLGLLPFFGPVRPSESESHPKQEMRKPKGGVAPRASRTSPESSARESVLAASQEPSGELPEVPDPLLFPVAQASSSGWAPLSEVKEPSSALPSAAVSSLRRAAPAARRSVRNLALVAPSPAAVAQADPRAMSKTAPTNAELSPPTAATVESGALSAAPHRSVAPSLASSGGAPVYGLAPPTAAPATAQLPSDQALFAQAMRKLRMEHDPAAALSAVQEHARAYPHSSLGGERSAIEVEALLALHRDREALARLDAMAIESLPRSGERLVMRGELRAAAHRWQEASADFDRALARVSGSPSWHERALWGRGVARLRCGEREAGMADIEGYHDSYPNGRFAAEAAKFFTKR